MIVERVAERRVVRLLLVGFERGWLVVAASIVLF